MSLGGGAFLSKPAHRPPSSFPLPSRQPLWFLNTRAPWLSPLLPNKSSWLMMDPVSSFMVHTHAQHEVAVLYMLLLLSLFHFFPSSSTTLLRGHYDYYWRCCVYPCVISVRRMCPILLCICLSGARSHDNLILGDATLFLDIDRIGTRAPISPPSSQHLPVFLATTILLGAKHHSSWLWFLLSWWLVEGGNFRANRPLVYNLWGMVSLGSSLWNWIAFFIIMLKNSYFNDKSLIGCMICKHPSFVGHLSIGWIGNYPVCFRQSLWRAVLWMFSRIP